jgi:hypothetical protein
MPGKVKIKASPFFTPAFRPGIAKNLQKFML